MNYKLKPSKDNCAFITIYDIKCCMADYFARRKVNFPWGHNDHLTRLTPTIKKKTVTSKLLVIMYETI